MEKWIVLFFVSWVGFGCSPDKPNSFSSLQPNVSWEEMKSNVYQRFVNGDTIIMSQEKLLMLLPAEIGSFHKSEDKGSSFIGKSARFSQASRVFFDSTQHYLAISVSDYAVDSTAFFYIYKKYSIGLENDEWERVNLPMTQSFGWKWKERLAPISYLEMGIKSRFHISVQTNHPDGQLLLLEIIPEIKERFLPEK